MLTEIVSVLRKFSVSLSFQTALSHGSMLFFALEH